MLWFSLNTFRSSPIWNGTQQTGFLVCTNLLFLHLRFKTRPETGHHILSSSQALALKKIQCPRPWSMLGTRSWQAIEVSTHFKFAKIYTSLEPCLLNGPILGLPTTKHCQTSNSEVRHGFKPFHFSELRHLFRNFVFNLCLGVSRGNSGKNTLRLTRFFDKALNYAFEGLHDVRSTLRNEETAENDQNTVQRRVLREETFAQLVR